MTNGRSDVLVHVGENLRRLREATGLTQVELAARSGISRRTIVNLEAGDANVGLASLDRLAEALGATFVDLVAAPSSPDGRIDAIAWRGGSRESEAKLLGRTPATSEAQLWSWVIGPGDRYDAQPDPAGWHEMIVVTDGQLVIEFAQSRLAIEQGDYAVYSSAQTYAYVNLGDSPARFIRNVVS